MSTRYSPRQLDTFLAVAELQNFRMASLRMNLTPSAISSQIAELEATLGFALFDRTTRMVQLTVNGRRFLPAAIAVQRQMERAATLATDIRDGATEIVRIAAPLVVAATILPGMIARRPRPAAIDVRVVDTAVVWLTDRVAVGDADLAIGPDRECPPHIVRIPLFPTPWLLWLRPDHSLSEQPSVAWSELEMLPLVAAGSDHENSVWPQLKKASVQVPSRVRIVEHVTTALGHAASDLGATFAPDYVRPLAAALGLVGRPLITPVVERKLCLYLKASDPSGPAVAEMIEHITAFAFADAAVQSTAKTG